MAGMNIFVNVKSEHDKFQATMQTKWKDPCRRNVIFAGLLTFYPFVSLLFRPLGVLKELRPFLPPIILHTTIISRIVLQMKLREIPICT